MCKRPVTAATNKQHSAAKDTAKLDRETEQLRRRSPNLPNALFIPPTLLPPDDTVTLSFSRALQQGRVAKSWSQKDLATVSSLPYPSLPPLSPSLPLLSLAIQYLHPFLSSCEPSSLLPPPLSCVCICALSLFESTPSLPSFLPGGTRGSTRNHRW